MSKSPYRLQRSPRYCALMIAAGILVCASCSAKAEYRVDVGDVLDLSVFNVAELRAHTRVNIDGDISFPLVGEVHVMGLTVPEVRTKVQGLLAEQVSHQRSPDAGTSPGGTAPGGTAPGWNGVNEVTVDIAEYRPIYVTGDVARAGEKAFRPGMTARQAILLAGGYDIGHGRINSTTSSPSDYAALSVDFVREKARIWRVESELAGPGDHAPPEMPTVAVPTDLLTKIIGSETDILKTDEANFQKELSQISVTARDVDVQISSLSGHIQNQKSELDIDVQDLAKIRQLFDKGLVTMERISNQRHEVFLATTQYLQAMAQLAQLKREGGDLDLRLSKLSGDRHIALLHELEEANIKLASTRIHLQGVGEKLMYVSTRETDLDEGGTRSSIMIFRRQNQASTNFPATEDSTVLPGDVVQVSSTSPHESVPDTREPEANARGADYKPLHSGTRQELKRPQSTSRADCCDDRPIGWGLDKVPMSPVQKEGRNTDDEGDAGTLSDHVLQELSGNRGKPPLMPATKHSHYSGATIYPLIRSEFFANATNWLVGTATTPHSRRSLAQGEPTRNHRNDRFPKASLCGDVLVSRIRIAQPAPIHPYFS